VTPPSHRPPARTGSAVRRTLGQVANERGRNNERRVLYACARSELPAWCDRVVAATSEEDARGIDVVAHTDVGKIFVQVKSSKAGKRAFNERARRNIAVVIVTHGDDDARVVRKVLAAIAEMRSCVVRARAGD
jgi:hypothetical protein